MVTGSCWRGCVVALLSAVLSACGGKSEREPSPPAEPEPANASRECAVNSDCAVVAPCCGPCGALAAEDALPLRRDQIEAFREACVWGSTRELPCPSTGTGCFRDSNPYLVPICERGMCGVLDLLKEPITECQNGGCTLRANECCGDESSTFISVSANTLTELDALLCDGEPVRTDCRTEPPMHQGAVCREGRCSSAFFEP